MKYGFSEYGFEKELNIKLHENPSIVSGIVPCRQTDRHDEANSSLLVILLTRLKCILVVAASSVERVNFLCSVKTQCHTGLV
jgi:hypothetical protein